jgi:hypothetical protein
MGGWRIGLQVRLADRAKDAQLWSAVPVGAHEIRGLMQVSAMNRLMPRKVYAVQLSLIGIDVMQVIFVAEKDTVNIIKR